ncbi:MULTISPECIES: hypothetical protein [unclassified Campylobacter]|uniref:hypothetical protein n=1 Tax=unclassified Campylobacter TaxID=2593542 RepID=UPI003D33DEF9
MIVSINELARLLGLTPRRISQLVSDEILTKEKRGEFDDSKNIAAYIDYKVALASETTDLTEARAKKEDKLAQIKEIELKKLKNEIVSIEQIEKELDDIASTVSNRLYNLTNRLKLKIDLSAQSEDAINEEIENILHELKDSKIYKKYNTP